MTKPLKLIAEDDEDLKIISAHLQDAVLRVGDLAYLPKSRRFAVLLNRYCWGDCDGAKDGERVLAGLHFDGVLGVKAQGIRQDDPAAMHELLAIGFTPSGESDDAGGTIDLLLAGGSSIRLTVECIEAVLSDMTGPWAARARPEHDLEAD